jgi:hypothetical protein
MNSLGRAALAKEEFVGSSADSCFKALSLGTLILAVRSEDCRADFRHKEGSAHPALFQQYRASIRIHSVHYPISRFVLCISFTHSALSCALASGQTAISSEAVLRNREHGRSRPGEICLRGPQILSLPEMRTGFPHLRLTGPRP